MPQGQAEALSHCIWGSPRYGFCLSFQFNLLSFPFYVLCSSNTKRNGSSRNSCSNNGDDLLTINYMRYKTLNTLFHLILRITPQAGIIILILQLEEVGLWDIK